MTAHEVRNVLRGRLEEEIADHVGYLLDNEVTEAKMNYWRGVVAGLRIAQHELQEAYRKVGGI